MVKPEGVVVLEVVNLAGNFSYKNGQWLFSHIPVCIVHRLRKQLNAKTHRLTPELHANLVDYFEGQTV